MIHRLTKEQLETTRGWTRAHDWTEEARGILDGLKSEDPCLRQVSQRYANEAADFAAGVERQIAECPGGFADGARAALEHFGWAALLAALCAAAAPAQEGRT